MDRKGAAMTGKRRAFEGVDAGTWDPEADRERETERASGRSASRAVAAYLRDLHRISGVPFEDGEGSESEDAD